MDNTGAANTLLSSEYLYFNPCKVSDNSIFTTASKTTDVWPKGTDYYFVLTDKWKHIKTLDTHKYNYNY